MKAFGQYLAENIRKGIIDFSFRATAKPDGDIAICIHPDSQDGETGDFLINGGFVRPDPDMQPISNPLKKGNDT